MSFPTADRPYPEQPYPAQPVPEGYLPEQPAPVAPRRSWLPDALAGLAVAIVVAGLGPGLGWLWSRIAPHPSKIMLSDGPYWARPVDEYVVADENIYLFLMIGTGIVLAVLAWFLLRRYRGPAVLLGLAVGGVAAGVLTYVVGYRIGYVHAQYLQYHAEVGTIFKMPVDLRVQQVGLWHGWLPFARGDVLSLGIAAVLLYVLFAGFSAYPSLRAPRRGEVGGEVSSD